MTEHGSQLHCERTLNRLEVRVGQTGRTDTHQHVTGRDWTTSTVSIVIGKPVCRNSAPRA